MGRLRKAVAARDMPMIASMMTQDFGFRLEPAGEGSGVFAYWDKNNVHVDRVEFVPITDSTARLASLRSGDLQMIERVSPTDLTQIREDSRLKVVGVAELKLVRLLQSRLNEDTTGFDKSRPAPDSLAPALRREIEVIEAGQDEIRDSLSRIAERAVQP